ncbi:MAG TPA: class I SAM-dependent methyltransferase [Candidatus Dormibacteraeota bacterium]|nr:class I SAM-dependent methyltransferase [Candidatus Dormibacteraeota bacterium]
MQIAEKRRWRFKGPEMEGPIARWYTRVRGSQSQFDLYRKQAAQLTGGLTAGARVLEVGPGPGYLAIEIARIGDLAVTGLDISHTFVEIAGENARTAGVAVDFRQGDVAHMPFESGSFDLIVCQAAFKNFTLPRSALAEMHRVLRPGGTAVIQDMSRDATHADIDREVGRMQLGRIATFTTKATLEMLKRRAYAPSELARLAAQSPFGTCEIETEGIGLEIRLTKETS